MGYTTGYCEENVNRWVSYAHQAKAHYLKNVSDMDFENAVQQEEMAELAAECGKYLDQLITNAESYSFE